MKNLLFILLLLIPVLSFSQKVGRAGGTGGLNLANLDQYLTADRLISGADLYDLTIDSLTRFNVYSPEFTLGMGATDLTTLIGTSTRWNEDNTGINLVDEFGLRQIHLRNIENDSLGAIVIAPYAVSIFSWDRESAGNSPEATGEIYVNPTTINLQLENSVSTITSELQLSPGVIRLYPRDSLQIQDYNQPDNFRESLTTVLALDTATNTVKLKTITPASNQWFTAGNGGSVIANTSGTTFTRTSSTIGTFSVPSGVEPSEFIIYHNTSQNPGTTYKIRINYAGSVTYNNNFNDIRPPEVHIGNATAVVANGGVATNTFRYTYSVTTGSVNLEKSITGFIDDVGYFELTLDNVDDAAGADDMIIKIKF